MEENAIGKVVVDLAIQVHRDLGPGLLESVYECILVHELRQRGLSAQRQVPIAVRYGELTFEEGFRADIVVEQKLIVELKCIERLNNAHRKQLLTYLRLADCKLGLLLNFSERLMKDGVIRIANGL